MITRENNDLVLRVPLFQKSYDALHQYVGDTANLIGVIAGREYSISHLIDLGYKGDQQEGSPVIMFDDREELEKVCKELGLDIWEHPLCAYCGKPIRGTFTYGPKGEKCGECDNK